MIEDLDVNQRRSLIMLVLRWGTLYGMVGGLAGGLLVTATYIVLSHENPVGIGGVVGTTVGGAIGASISAYSAFRNLLDPNYAKTAPVDLVEHLELPLPYDLAFNRAVA